MLHAASQTYEKGAEGLEEETLDLSRCVQGEGGKVNEVEGSCFWLL